MQINTIRKGSGNVIRLIAQLKCLYANARSMGNKQEELETVVQLDKYDLIALREMWCDGSHNWNIGIEGYKLLRKDKQRRKGGVLPSTLGKGLIVKTCL